MLYSLKSNRVYFVPDFNRGIVRTQSVIAVRETRLVFVQSPANEDAVVGVMLVGMRDMRVV